MAALREFPAPGRRRARGEPLPRPIRQCLGLCETYVLGLQTLGALLNHERDASAFVERAIAASFNCREMDENIFAVLALNEAESFGGVKPLYSTCFFHRFSLLESTACRIDQGWSSRGQAGRGLS